MRGTHLLERADELAALGDAVAGAVAGEGRLVVVEGPAGIGKSRLLGAGRATADEAGMRVLAARASELEREFPYGVVRQLFEGAVAGREGDALFVGAASGCSAVFAAPDDPGEEGAAGSYAILHGLYWLTLNLADGEPVSLAVDDLHWTDAPSLRFLSYLAHRLEGAPVLVVATVRAHEPAVDERLLAELVRDPGAVVIRPAPLSAGAVAAVVAERLGAEPAPAFAAACQEVADGNPLLLGQLLAALQADGVAPDAAHAGRVRDVGPRALSSTVLLRLGRLSPGAIAVARAVAVLGDAAHVGPVAELTGLSAEAVAGATGELARAEILRSDTRLGFVHALVRDAVYLDMPPGERELQHARAARMLANGGAPPEQVAAHLLAVPPAGDPEAARALHAAGRAALRSGAPESAAPYLRRALAEPPVAEDRAALLFELGGAEASMNGAAAAEPLRAAYAELKDPVARAVAAGLLGRMLMFIGDPHGAVAVVRTAAADLPPDLHDLARALNAFEALATLFGAGDPEAAFAELATFRSEPLGPGPGPGARLLQATAALAWAYGGGSAEECVELAAQALDDGQLVAADPGLGAVAPIIVLALADRDEAVTALEAALAEGRRHGSLFTVAGLHLWEGFVLCRRGDLDAAEAQLRTCWTELDSWGFGPEAARYAGAFLSAVLLERGDLAGSREALERSHDPGDRSDGTRFWLNAQLELLVAEGRADATLDAADEFAARYPHYRNPAYARWRSCRAQALDRLGRRDEAIALVEQELGHARAWGAPGPVGTTLRILGTMKREDGLADLRAAVDVLGGSAARLEHAKALAALGAALRRGKQIDAAREPLREALELASVCGADGLAEHVRAELRASGVRPRRDALSGPESLTASERRVADRAASGETNRDIAQSLFVTPKTVEVHLSNAYRKLGIRSRRELAGALGAPA